MPNNQSIGTPVEYTSALYAYLTRQINVVQAEINAVIVVIHGQITTIQDELALAVADIASILDTYISGPDSVSAGSIPVFNTNQTLDESAISITGTGVINGDDSKIDMGTTNEIDIVATTVKVNGVPVSANGDLTVYMPKSGGTFTGPITVAQIIPTTTAGIVIPGKLFILGTRPVCSGGFSMTTNPASLSNTTVETVILGTGSGSLTSLANTVTVGTASRSFLSGYIDTTGSPIITFRVYTGPTSNILISSFVISPGTLTLVPWRLESMLTCRAIGSGTTGKLQINSFFVLHDTSNANTFVNNPLVDFDTTVANIFRITAQWSVALPGNVLNVDTFNSMGLYFT